MAITSTHREALYPISLFNVGSFWINFGTLSFFGVPIDWEMQQHSGGRG